MVEIGLTDLPKSCRSHSINKVAYQRFTTVYYLRTIYRAVGRSKNQRGGDITCPLVETVKTVLLSETSPLTIFDGP